jgi:hypothetical protein
MNQKEYWVYSGYLISLAEDNKTKIDGIKSALHYAKELAEKEKEE